MSVFSLEGPELSNRIHDRILIHPSIHPNFIHSHLSLVGPKLSNWIDDLVSKFFFIHSFCVIDEVAYEHNNNWRARTREKRFEREGARVRGGGGGGMWNAGKPQQKQQQNQHPNSGGGDFLDTILKISPDASKCEDTLWSSQSPDPKSDFGPVDFHTGKLLRKGEKPKPPPQQQMGGGGRIGNQRHGPFGRNVL